MNDETRRNLYAIISEGIADGLPAPIMDADPTRASLYRLLGVPAHTMGRVSKDTAYMIDKGALTLPPLDPFSVELESYSFSQGRDYDLDRVNAMRWSLSVRYGEYARIPHGFRARVREWWRLTKRGHELQRGYAEGRLSRADWQRGENLLNRAWCVLLGRHRWSYDVGKATCRDCNVQRALPNIVTMTNLVSPSW